RKPKCEECSMAEFCEYAKSKNKE
ncbi:MAG: endonuclease III, partial [Clostridia bacterium]|nr:endonuclease III [Clostridia bacterium]